MRINEGTCFAICLWRVGEHEEGPSAMMQKRDRDGP